MPFSQESLFSAQGSGSTGIELWSYGGKNTYAASTEGSVDSGTASSTSTSLFCLYHPSGATTYRIQEIYISWAGGNNTTSLRLQSFRVTVQPAGTSHVVNPLDPSDPVSTAVVISSFGLTSSNPLGSSMFGCAIEGSVTGKYIYRAGYAVAAKPISLKFGTGEGIIIGTILNSAFTSTMTFSVHAIWTEE